MSDYNAKIIDHKFWLNKANGRRASVYGSVPWVSDAEREQWTMATAGWTIRWPDGTIGTGRPAFAAYDEAEAYLAKAKERRFPGWNQG